MTLPDLHQTSFTQDDLVAILSATESRDLQAIQHAAEEVLLTNCGDRVYFRGLVEASNICRCDCHYCGIRKSNAGVERFELTEDDILSVAHWCIDQHFGSMVIQTGERLDKRFLDVLEKAIRRIKKETISDAQPEGLGITLSLGEHSEETYRRLYEAGAHRYLLRIETTNPDLFARIHPANQTFENRVECLKILGKIGYQVGTGVMIGLPGQTLQDLANDLLFFKTMDIDMIGMGPFIPHADTPMGSMECPPAERRLQLGLLMIAAARLLLRDVNIAATTALQALDPQGREKALRFGANVMMPLMTPRAVREKYLLYPGKPGLDETDPAFKATLLASLTAAGRVLGQDEWGDSAHARRKATPSPANG